MLLLALASSCDARRAEPSAAAPTTSPSPSAPPALPPAVVAPKEPSPLRAASPIVDLTVPGHPAAVVSLPIGATSRRPVVIAAHGNYGRPEWQCQAVRDLFEDRAFILCPRGIPRDNSPGPDDVRFTYESNAALELEIDAGLRALTATYPDYVDPGPPLYMGFSLGAIQGVAIAALRIFRGSCSSKAAMTPGSPKLCRLSPRAAAIACSSFALKASARRTPAGRPRG
ncbi:hypothetical protein [Polyangium sp. 6x1]|uniref:hypothetical protein n=1 Tax=Polyangium sp. 6x1 TaxID=3042689 RepID=UPI00248272D9|nr:hypothetical protein [Polyangium sp. 6x1]MDI1450936.1 hypothetical protein [Polyangium sp. 6x1]